MMRAKDRPHRAIGPQTISMSHIEAEVEAITILNEAAGKGIRDNLPKFRVKENQDWSVIATEWAAWKQGWLANKTATVEVLRDVRHFKRRAHKWSILVNARVGLAVVEKQEQKTASRAIHKPS